MARFNLGDYDVKATAKEVVVHGKRSRKWHEDIVLERPGIQASISQEPRRALIILYVAYFLYAFAFVMLFVVDGVSTTHQISLFGAALLLLLAPLIFHLVLPVKAFAVASAAFFLVLFSVPGIGVLEDVFEIVEEFTPEGYVETFLILAAAVPIILHVMVSQAMIKYRLVLEEGSKRLEIVTFSPAARTLVDYIEGRPIKRPGAFSLRRFLGRLPFFFLRLSKTRTKRCHYCGNSTFQECTRCHTPMCDDHCNVLHGFRVCRDCYAERRGRTKEILR